MKNEKHLVRNSGLAFRFKVLWFRDILQHPEARCYLWSLYFAGEAYEALHPEGVFVGKLPLALGKSLEKHLQDETRHAKIFQALLEEEKSQMVSLSEEEDVGWYLLNHVVPEVTQAAGEDRPFTTRQIQRYMGFLHLLELRSLSDLCALIQAASDLGEAKLADRLRTILPDERFHATYTHRALFELSSHRQEAKNILAELCRSEKKFYQSTMLRILKRFEALGAVPKSFGATWRWRFTKLLAWLGMAAPLLPSYERLPTHLIPISLER